MSLLYIKQSLGFINMLIGSMENINHCKAEGYLAKVKGMN